MIEVMGADKVISVDTHNNQIVGFYYKPMIILEASNAGIKHFIKNVFVDNKENNNYVVVSPDANGMSRAR